jgi:CheY-like chemotaxis protein/signal transduction histidine kinase
VKSLQTSTHKVREAHEAHTLHTTWLAHGLCAVAVAASCWFVAQQPTYNVTTYAVGLGVCALLLWVQRWWRMPGSWVSDALLATTWALLVMAVQAWAQDATLAAAWPNAAHVLAMVMVCGLLQRHEREMRGAYATRGAETQSVSKHPTQANTAINQPSVNNAPVDTDTLLAAVSHEMRTPMNAILGLNGVLRTLLKDQPQDLEAVERIRAATEQLLQVVNLLLDHARLRAHRLHYVTEPVALEALLASCVQAHETAAHSKGVTITLEASDAQRVWVDTDSKRLQQIVGHLLDEAIEAAIQSGNQGAVTLHVKRASADAKNQWHFEVKVTDGDSRAKSSTSRGSNRADRDEGLASVMTLRRAVCEQLVQWLQVQHEQEEQQPGLQRLTPHAQQGQKAPQGLQAHHIWFTLPLKEVTPPAHTSSTNDHTSAALTTQAWQILVVDDHELNRVVAALLVRKLLPNAAVTACQSAQEAIALLQAQPFDLVMMDIIMPDIDGMTATRQLRAQAGPNAQTPVLAMTGVEQPEDRVACLAAGMQGLVSKPLRETELLHALLQVLPVARTQTMKVAP